jgi:hypothetical protein
LLSISTFLYKVFPPFALMQKVEPKDQGCPDAPPGSRANAQQPRATGCIFPLKAVFLFLHLVHCMFPSSRLSTVPQVYQSLGAEFRSVSYNHSIQHSRRNEALDQSLRSKNVQR